MSKSKRAKRKTKRAKAAPSPPRREKTWHVWLNVLPEQLWFKVRRGITIWEALENTDVELEGDCGGLGKCGKCKVKVVSALGPPTPEERELLEPSELAQGVRLACRTSINRDMQIDIQAEGPTIEHNQILKTGYRVIVQLDPLIDQRIVTATRDFSDDGLADLDRIKLVLGAEYQDLRASLDCLRTLPSLISETGFEGAAVVHGESLLALQRWEKVGRRYGLVFDLGTSTVVGKLISLLDGNEIAAISCLNSQIKYGTNVVSRLQYVMENRNGLHRLNQMIVNDINRLTRALLEVGRLDADDVFVTVMAGNTTMQHIFLNLPPQGIATAPFAPVLTDGLVVRARDVGLELHPEALTYVMPARSGYVGGDLISVLLASRAAEQDRDIILGMDLGTNGEIFIGNSRRTLTCSAAAGPALEGARITHGMIARTGAIEGVSFVDDGIYYRTIGNTKPRGLCGSGLVDLVSVLLHCGAIDYEGLIRAPEDVDVEVLKERLIPGDDGLYDFLIASREESYHGKPIYLKQEDVRELQLAKGAIAAGVEVLVNELGVTYEGLGAVCMAGALGNYVNIHSAMRVGLLPTVNPEIIVSLGNGATTGAAMVLLSRSHWQKAELLSDFIEHVELSTRLDFNERFVANLDFPQENMW